MCAKQGQNSELGVLDAALLLKVLVIAAVEKYVLLAAVPMHIAVESDSAFPTQVPDHLLGVVDGLVEELVWLQPFPVQVAA